MSPVANSVAREPVGAPQPSRNSAVHGAEIRVRIANPHSPALLGVRLMLAGVRDVLVIADVGIASSPQSAYGDADVVIAELASGDVAAPVAILELLRSTATTQLLIMSARRDVAWILAALDAGAAGVVATSASREALLIAVRAIASGQIVLPRRAISALTARAREEMEVSHAHPCTKRSTTDAEHELARLTGRERSVFRMIAQGYSAPEVGTRLSISKKTVETYKRRITEKLGLSHRTDYVRFALLSDTLVSSRGTMVE